MTKSKKTDQELIEFLTKHLAYECEMLGFTFKRLHDTEVGYGWNMAYESFCMHARNLYDFFRNNGTSQTTFRACDYNNNYPKAKSNPKFNDLDSFNFHLSVSRETIQYAPNLKQLREYGAWLDKEWKNWLSTLPKSYKSILPSGPMCPQDLVLKIGVTLETACTSPTAIVSSSTQIDTQPLSTKSDYFINTKL